MGGNFGKRSRLRQPSPSNALAQNSTDATVGETIRWLLAGRGQHRHPTWPPDLFAIAAYLVQRTGCYAAVRPEAIEYRDRAMNLGSRWRTNPADEGVQARLASLWEQLLASGAEALQAHQPYSGSIPNWCMAALELLCIADEASAGIGVSPPPDALPAWRYWKRSVDSISNPELSEDRTLTACLDVPSDRVCVQPKMRSPRVGCTMRSLSHHLALLPPKTEMRTRWLMIPDGEQGGLEPLNVLVVPYPYRIAGRSFRATTDTELGWGLFQLEQTWLPDTPEEFGDFLSELLLEAQKEVSQVDGIVLPELALERGFADRVAGLLAKQQGLEFFVTGALETLKKSDDSPRPTAGTRNLVTGYLYNRGRIVGGWRQSKHHRWKLDASQIATYSLGHALSPDSSWWEDIDVSDRTLFFYQVRPGASLAFLICEDLARQDPVQSAVRACGPSLLVALLMDGAQLAGRWPGRYATVLAEDPGSSVLSVTSRGMVMRGFDRHTRPSMSVGLWRDSSGRTRELELENGNHALLLTLSASSSSARTMDGRPTGNPVSFQLTGVRQLSARFAPKWLDY